MTGDFRRDPAIDPLLGRTLGTEAGAAVDCPDAETMAAWFDGGLDEVSRARAEMHAAGCARCQAMLKAIAVMDDGTAAAAVIGTPAASARRPGSLRWLVPIAAAAGLVLTVLLLPDREAGLPTLATRQETREADLRLPLPEPVAPPTVGRAEAPPPGRAAPPPAANAPPALERRTADTSFRKAALADAGVLAIASPDPSIQWRVAGATVERSTDAGVTWTAVPTGIDAGVAAGSSPSADTCWLVGRGGVVLLTTDARTWRRLSFPEPTDLVAVAATDGRTATVTTADGRTFETVNAGQTWVRRAPLQELGTAPF